MTRLQRSVNILTKWRVIFAGWQLGTRPKTDPECQAVSDHREVTMLMRAEQSAFLGILLAKGICTEEEWEAIYANECDLLSKSYEERFPGATAHPDGIHLDPAKAHVWMSKFPK